MLWTLPNSIWPVCFGDSRGKGGAHQLVFPAIMYPPGRESQANQSLGGFYSLPLKKYTQSREPRLQTWIKDDNRVVKPAPKRKLQLKKEAWHWVFHFLLVWGRAFSRLITCKLLQHGSHFWVATGRLCLLQFPNLCAIPPGGGVARSIRVAPVSLQRSLKPRVYRKRHCVGITEPGSSYVSATWQL